MIRYSKYIIPKNYTGLAIYPFIFLKSRNLADNWVLINHERIHLKQQVEMLWILFFVWYYVEFLINFCWYFNWNKAYRGISFEKEAYENEGDPNYLSQRKPWAFLRYIG